jgi:ABC-2 type transport system permease protein
MAANAALQPVNERGPLRGFGNLFAKENGAWWRTRSWIMQTLIWLAILNGITAMLLWVAPAPEAPTGANVSPVDSLMANQANAGLFIFFVVGGVATVIGAVIIGQDALIAEKTSGTAAWVLSKPVSRSAFILSKLAGDGLGMLVTMILIQGLIAFIQIRAAGGTVTLAGFAAGLGLLFLNLLYYYSLTLMLGALFHSRGPVIGIPLAVVFGYQLVLGLPPWLGQIMPWALTNTAGVNAVPLTAAAALGMPLETPWPIVGTLVGCVVFVAVALWRFEREEF